ncbi:MAG TPA: glycerate kinase [Stenomitos sp.]
MYIYLLGIRTSSLGLLLGQSFFIGPQLLSCKGGRVAQQRLTRQNEWMQHSEPSNCPTIAIALDSFKGTLTAAAAVSALATGLRQTLPQARILQWPLADGGEGTLAAFQTLLEGTLQYFEVETAAGIQETVPVYICQMGGHSAVVIEVAQVVGITNPRAMQLPITQRTTVGVGQLIQCALDQGIQQIYIGLGGSCTNEGGAGLLTALGVQLRDANGRLLAPTIEGLLSLAEVEASHLDPRLADSHIVLLSDVASPLCGPQGATHTFGPQKGLTEAADRHRIDEALGHFATLAQSAMTTLQRQAPDHCSLLPGAGAAGGLGFALQLLGAKYCSGAQFIAELLNLPHHVNQVDWLITGEGRSDRQTLQGKAPWALAQMGQTAHIPVTLLSGVIAPEDRAVLEQAFGRDCLSLAPGDTCCFPPSLAPSTEEDCRTHAYDWMVKAGAQLGHRWQTSSYPFS